MKAMKAAVALFLMTALIGGFIGWAQTPRPSPTNASAGSGGTCAALGGDVTGTCAASTVANGSHITNASIPNTGLVNTATTVNGQTCTLGSSCTATAVPSGAAGGDLSGTYPNPGVAKINGTSFTGTSGHLASFGASNTPADSGIVASAVTQTVGSGTIALATSAIASATCSAAQTVTINGTATTDALMVTFNADPTAVTGYTPSTNGMLTIIPYPTSNTGNVKVCNNTSASITPGAVTLNVRVVR